MIWAQWIHRFRLLPIAQDRHSYFTTYRQGDWKLIYQYNPESNKNVERYQLYNLAKDPNESHNFASTKKGKLADMVKAMRNKLTEQNAQYPISSNGTELEPELPN
jgi:arylsulfatase A-like enzyme